MLPEQEIEMDTPDAPTPASSASPAPSGSSSGSPPAWLPQKFFDPQTGIKPEFGAHYTEVAKFYETETAAREALKARKPDDIKFEVKLPDTVKVPEGMQVRIDEKDPRIPIIREMALKRGWDQDTVNELVAFDARIKIEAHNAEAARVVAEDAQLGEKGKERKDAIVAWAKQFAISGGLTPDEAEELKLTATTAAGVTLLEKLIAKANGSVPGAGGHQPPPQKPAEVPIEQRWYGNATSSKGRR